MAVNGDHDLLRHAGFRLDPREPGAVCEIGRAAAADARRVDMLAAIRLELGNGGVGAAAGLVLVELDDSGIWRKATNHTVQRHVTIAHRPRLRAVRLDFGPKCPTVPHGQTTRWGKRSE